MDVKIFRVADIKRRHNYRRRRNKASYESIKADIEQRGILTPVLVRPVGEGVELVAGSTRVDIVKELHGIEGLVPALIKEMTDEEVIAAQVAENKAREDTTAIEDAEAACELLGKLNGDRAETARRLRWSEGTLSRRLALMNAVASVRDAFLEDKIDLGHAEIMAALPREVQEVLIARVLERKPTVQEFKAMAEAALMRLDAAIFDKQDCLSCKFNAGNQQALFDVALEGSRCTNGTCYKEKTEEELEKRRLALTETYQVVRIVRQGDQNTVVPLRAEGARGVGEEQAEACRMCGDFGACVSASPDKLGREFKEMCFNTSCNEQKVKDNQDRLAAAQAAANASASTAPVGGDASKGKAGAANAPKTEKETVKEAANFRTLRGFLQGYRDNVLRAVYLRAVRKFTPVQVQQLLLSLLLETPESFSDDKAFVEVARVCGWQFSKSKGMGELIARIRALEPAARDVAYREVAAQFHESAPLSNLSDVMKSFNVRVADYWGVNASFFDLLTKTEIEAVCQEIGIASAMGEKFAKIKGGPKADFIKAVSDLEGFDYKGKIPAFMNF